MRKTTIFTLSFSRAAFTCLQISFDVISLPSTEIPPSAKIRAMFPFEPFAIKSRFTFFTEYFSKLTIAILSSAFFPNLEVIIFIISSRYFTPSIKLCFTASSVFTANMSSAIVLILSVEMFRAFEISPITSSQIVWIYVFNCKRLESLILSRKNGSIALLKSLSLPRIT